ncbi:MAG: GNAT family N-acetyltransferase [Pseudomonadota bacterium]
MIRVAAMTGQAVLDSLKGVAALRIAVFRDWPYLYDGDLAYESTYLKAYTKPGAVIVGAWDGSTFVGASTGAPMEDHAADFATGLPVDWDLTQVFYCAESVLLPQYRGQGIGHQFFDFRESHARALGRSKVCFCSVIRDPGHPLCPSDYRPLDPFWTQRGYAPVPGAVAQFSWKDRGDATETFKSLQFWARDL